MITQIDAKIYDALRARLSAMPGGVAIVYPAQVYPTDVTIPFIVVSDVKFGNERFYIGSSADDVYTGNLMLDVMTPISWTQSQTLGIAGNIRAWFNKDLVLGNVVRINQTPYVTMSYRDGGFMRLPVSISWRAVG